MAEPQRRLASSEEIDAQVSDLMKFARERGKQIRDAHKGRVYTLAHRLVPGDGELLASQLREALEDELVEAAPVTDEGGISPWELDHELMKKALVGLKLPGLRNVARRIGVGVSAKSETLAEAIARHYKWNEQEIARAILEEEGRLAPSLKGHHDRLVPLLHDPDINYVAEQLQMVLQRYVRIGIARWFVFDDLQAAGDSLQLSGSVRTYRAYVDDSEEEPRLGASPSERRIDIFLEAGKSVARIRRASQTDARSAMQALSLAGSVAAQGFVPLRATDGLNSWDLTFDRVTLFMLDLLGSRLRHQQLGNFDLNVARFRLSEDADEGPEAGSVPSLEAVRFEGRHILDSTEACRLIAIEGRSLVSLSLNAELPPRPDGTRALFPLHVSFDDWSVAVSTGLGRENLELSVAAHHALREAVSLEIEEGIADVRSLNELSERIVERATFAGVPDRADLLAGLDDVEGRSNLPAAPDT